MSETCGVPTTGAERCARDAGHDGEHEAKRRPTAVLPGEIDLTVLPFATALWLDEQLRLANEAGYRRCLADMRAEATRQLNAGAKLAEFGPLDRAANLLESRAAVVP